MTCELKFKTEYLMLIKFKTTVSKLDDVVKVAAIAGYNVFYYNQFIFLLHIRHIDSKYCY